MAKIKALLVGICEYPATKNVPLPLCKNDLYAVKSAFITGLNVHPNDILLCGENGTVTSKEMLTAISKSLFTATHDDTFIFYFSGHGGKNCLALSDGRISLEAVIDLVAKTVTKNKVIILDACRSGGFSMNGTAQMDLSESIESFAGHGYAVLASCGAEEGSGFNYERQISLYTSFLCDALTSRYLIRKGQKSLEAINEAIFQYATAWNRKNNTRVQQPIFRSNIGGTIFFDVEEYNPYKVTKVYEETDKYIIYSVKPVHHASAKRLSAKIILNYKSSKEQIAEITLEVKEKILYYEVHQNAIAEARHLGNPANIVWCFFGYDEDDMVDPNFAFHTTWVDDSQDKDWWYRKTKNSKIVSGVFMEENSSYEMVKKLMHDEAINKDSLISKTREFTAELVSVAETYIQLYREYRNNTISEEHLIDEVAPLNKIILELFLKQSNLPVPPLELHDWADAHTQIAGAISDFSLFYNKSNLNKWETKNRMFLMDTSIKRYEEELEILKMIDDNLS